MKKQIAERKFNYIYKITRFDGMFYIGRHASNKQNDSYFGSGTYIVNSLRKHGKEKHTKEILEYLPNLEALKTREKEIVNEAILQNPNCMNIRTGGSGGDHDYATREKISKIAKAVGQRPEVKKGRSNRLSIEWATKYDSRLASMRSLEATANRRVAAKNRNGWIYNPNSAISHQKLCTVDGDVIFSSRKALIKALGQGKNGLLHPSFRYL